MAKLIVVTRDGTEHEIEGDTSLTVMENIELIKKKISGKIELDKNDILKLLAFITTDLKHEIFKLADDLRAEIMGDDVFIRSIIEFSN